MNKLNTECLSTRAQNVLTAEGIFTEQQLRQLTYIGILRMPRAGRKVASEIMELIDSLPKQESNPASDTCATCRYMLNVDTHWGVCRRYPPSIAKEGYLFPKIHNEQWCGEHKL